MPLKGATPVGHPVVHGRLHPLGPGKDTITGHWELMGVVTPVPLRTYPDGFPDDVIERAAGRHRPRRPLQPPVLGDRGDRRLRRAAPADR